MEPSHVVWTHPRGVGPVHGYSLRQIPRKPHPRCPPKGRGSIHMGPPQGPLVGPWGGRTLTFRPKNKEESHKQSLDEELQKAKEKATSITNIVQPLPKIAPLFPQRLKKKNEDEKFRKFLLVFKILYINLTLVEALVEMLGYAKFMKELVTKKRSMDFETIKVSHNCSVIMTSETITKKEDPGAFTISCTIGMLQFAKALCDFGASINLISYEIYKQLGLGEPKSTTMRLLMADRSIKHPVGILYDILVKVDQFIFPADLVILDCEIDAEIPIILRRPFLATGRTLVDVEIRELKF
ncbi:hypothetical protein KY290_003564 [Solanum tuberosum]|uniref:Aspartic peptidase DDI1-type domain-containing protein n=1 Tax=Solanum tuberosum TaxID=4113 RepID=A0ABQ7WT97_SOLTU|nr:hypothetical protein KY284_003709 [Solanum tuberosum]KAH0732717.1 hypothetical protein KY289_003905 [Solanum tuberosum]KAH0767688.1 hypothetical protein KY285_003559 [Solanum tuberosum]KAH0783966.1 hypothetical protein KY290_003564 [Solanum tuberosum]